MSLGRMADAGLGTVTEAAKVFWKAFGEALSNRDPDADSVFPPFFSDWEHLSADDQIALINAMDFAAERLVKDLTLSGSFVTTAAAAYEMRDDLQGRTLFHPTGRKVSPWGLVEVRPGMMTVRGVPNAARVFIMIGENGQATVLEESAPIIIEAES